MTDPANPFPMLRYVLQFVAFSVLIVAAMLAVSLISWIGLPPSSGIAALFLAVFFVAMNIARRERRVPTRRECMWFATWASLVVNGLSVLLLAATLAALSGSLAMLAPFLQETAVLLVSFGFGLVLTWLITYFTLGAFVRLGLKQLAKQEQSAPKQ